MLYYSHSNLFICMQRVKCSRETICFHAFIIYKENTLEQILQVPPYKKGKKHIEGNMKSSNG